MAFFLYWNKIIQFRSFLDIAIFPEEINVYLFVFNIIYIYLILFNISLFIQMVIVYSHLCNTSASMDRYSDQNYKRIPFVFAHFSWAELKDLSLFQCTQKAYFSQILFTNLSKSVLVSTSLPR